MARHCPFVQCPVMEEKTKATSLVLHCPIQTTLNDVSASLWLLGGARKVSQMRRCVIRSGRSTVAVRCAGIGGKQEVSSVQGVAHHQLREDDSGIWIYHGAGVLCLGGRGRSGCPERASRWRGQMRSAGIGRRRKMSIRSSPAIARGSISWPLSSLRR
jgi:hypothetical protein